MKSLFKILSILVLTTILYAQPNFPKLTGRVVDNANLLTKETIVKLNSLLSNLEQNSSNQLVVVTLPSLQGYDIADFGYQLGRHWGIGQKGKDNGVLLIIAPKERKVRIEVGYGLEGTLTDALSSVIIQDKILPYFKKSDFNQGILSGVKAIIGVINGTYKPTIKKRKKINPLAPQLFFGLFFLTMILEKFTPTKYKGVIKNMMPSEFAGLFAYLISMSVLIGIGVLAIVFLLLSFIKVSNNSFGGSNTGWYSSDDSFGGGDFGGFGGFSGGGGGFGGGGASGGW